MKIKYFAWIKNITNTDTEEISSNNIIDIESLKVYLCKKYPKLEDHLLNDQLIRISVNLEYVQDNIKLTNNDEIAIFPPVSGG
jgi:molybdopterin converting factor subunit 1